MAIIAFEVGVDDNNDPLALAPVVLTEGTGLEYRFGHAGVWTARGRKQIGDAGSITGRALYYGGFDDDTDVIVVHEGNNYSTAQINTFRGLSFTTGLSFGTNTSPLVGTHIANKHALANGSSNMVLEADQALRLLGMAGTSLTIGLSITQGSGGFTVGSSLTYWLTERDSVRGIEGVAGVTVATAAFTSLDSVVLTISGTSLNTNMDEINIYRSLDGGVFPDGELLATVAGNSLGFTDVDTTVNSLAPTRYGIATLGGLDHERDERPGALTTVFGPFRDALCGFVVGEPRVMRFTPPGFHESWPAAFQVPLETHRHDIGMGGRVLSGRLGVFTRDSIHTIFRLPSDSDSIFASGEMADLHTDQRGLISRRGLARVNTSAGPFLLFVARDGIWATNLSSSPTPLTDSVDWEAHVQVNRLGDSVLRDDPKLRRVVFAYFRAADTSHPTGVMYLDYATGAFRITHPDHGALADLALAPDEYGSLRLHSIDSRASNGQIYTEASKDSDDSQLVDVSGSINVRLQTAEFMPGGIALTARMGKAHWLHGPGSNRVTQEFTKNRETTPERKHRDWSVREVDDIELGKTVNTFQLALVATTTRPFPIVWVDVDGFAPAGAEEGAA